jgi:large subunit ribosomal protein L25
MSTARATLAAEHRQITGKKVAGLRRAGRLPAVVYGHGIDSANVTVDTHEFVLVHAVQVHPVNRRPLHVDLFLVRMTEELTVDVPLVATGESPAVTLNGGTLLHPTESVRIRALPDHLPQSIEYAITSLVDFDTAIHVRDQTIPSDVTLLTDGDEIIAKVQQPRVEEEPVVAEAVEGEEGEAAAEGEGAAEGAATEPGSGDSDTSEG